MRRGVVIYFLIIFVVLSLVGSSVLTTYAQFVEEGPLEKRTEVLVEAGNLRKIARRLHRAGVIASPSIFEIGVRANGNGTKIKVGEYSIPPRASAKMVMNILTSGQTYIRRLVVPEGLTSAQVVALMDNAVGLVGEVTDVPRNGTLLPDTYHYSYGDTKEGIIVRMKNAMTRTLDELWEHRAEGLPIKTPQEAVILASVVEKETSLNRERARVAGVFCNRLHKKMRLQSDPTVIYAVTDGRLDLERSLTYKDLRTKHPYNTYVIQGLPRGPIANPGRASLQAVLNPANTNELYFVADGTGGHVFAENYEQHQKNVQNWRQVQKRGKQKSTPTPLIKPVD